MVQPTEPWLRGFFPDCSSFLKRFRRSRHYLLEQNRSAIALAKNAQRPSSDEN
jgi:hypothetical protein